MYFKGRKNTLSKKRNAYVLDLANDKAFVFGIFPE